jgi:parallel beta-helix repeat protein
MEKRVTKFKFTEILGRVNRHSSRRIVGLICSFILVAGFSQWANAQLTVTIGTGTSATATVGPTYISSAASTYLWSNHISIFTPTEINAAGAILTGMSWNKSNSEGYTLNNAEFRIYLKHTSTSSIPSTSGTFATELVGATLVYESITQNLPLAPGWVDFMFNTPNAFSYNGIDNLMVLVDWYRPGSPTGAVPWLHETGLTGYAQTWSSDANPPTIGYGPGSRPNIQIHYIYPNIPHDAGVVAINDPVFPSAPGLHDVKATITTLAVNNLTSCTINWAVNGVAQTPYSWTGNLAQFATAGPITLGSFNFPQGVNEIMVWTTNPNNQVDSFPGNDTATVSFLFTTPLSGSYTVGGPTADFPDLATVVTALDGGGMAGPVTLNFDSAYAPYTGGVEFSNIGGNSATNTLTLLGHGSTITEGAATYLIALNGMTHVTIDGFNIINTNPVAANKFGIMIRGGSQHITITNNYIDMGTTSTSTATAGICVTGSTTTALTAGNNAQYVTITNNEIVGGYYGITLYGNSSYLDNYGHVVTDNIIRDWHYYGIRTQDTDSLVFARNNVSRANRQSTYTIFYAMYNLRLRHSLIMDNHFHTTGPTTSSSYGIYTSASENSAGNPTEYINNAFYNYTTTGLVYGIYLLGTQTNINIYYNTIHIESGGTTAKRALWMSGTSTNINVLNNIFSIRGGGTGTKYCIYMTSVPTNFVSNNNVLHMGATAGTNHIGYWTTNRTSLLDWQTATLQDGNSLNVDPSFPAVDDFKSTSFDIWKAGTPIPTVTTDIFGTPRNPLEPCIGAYEFVLVHNDAGITMMTEPVAVCGGPATVKVLVQNYGIVALNSVTVEWSVNGVAQTPVSLTSMGLAPGNSTEVSLGSYTFVNNVPYNFVFNTSLPNGVADQQTGNDTLFVDGMLSGLAGTYTIGSGVTDDFSTIADAIDALNSRGVCAAVVFNVNPLDGPYVGGVEIRNVVGTSATNTVVFNGNGAVLNESTPTFILAMDGASHITINDFQIINSNPSVNKFGIMLRGGCQHINITDNYIDMGTTSTSTLTAGIVASGSVTSATTAGNNAQYVTITDNTIIGGYYGISLLGTASYLDNYGHNIANNILSDFYLYGIYLANADTTIVSENNISRSTRTSISTFYGIYGTTCRNVKILKNHVHSSGVGSYTAYPIWLATTANTMGFESEIVNNLIYNIPTTSTFYGIYASGTINYLNIYHNTVYLTPTGGSGATRGIFLAVAPNNSNVFNNIISIVTQATGVKYGIYVTTTSTSFAADNNVYHLDAPGTNNHVGYWTANQTTLGDWQLASSQDGNSSVSNPVFASPVTGNMIPLSGSIDNMGTPVGVATDIYGALRSTMTPDVGAIEFTGIASDLAMIGGQLVNGQCLSANDSVYITFANVIGSQVNFSTATTTLFWSVTGPVNSAGNIVVNSGTLDPNTELTVGGAGVDLSEPGIYTLSVWLGANSVNLFAGNDTLVDFSTHQIYDPFYVDPKLVIVTDPTQTVDLSAKSTFFPGGAFYITEICHWRGASNGAPVGGWPSYLIADDYIEIVGAPNSDLAGYTLEQWSETAVIATHTFPTGTVMSPNGTAIIAVGQMGSSVPSPTDFYYHGDGGVNHTFGSTTPAGRILKDGSGNIIDAVGYGTYTFPAAANVTPADWSGNTPAISSAGNRLEGAYDKSAANWVNSSVSPMDPNVVNAGVTLPIPGTLTGFTWSHNGIVFATNVIDTVVGPWATNGTYHYIASYVTPCGTLTDTVTIIVSILTGSGDTTICEGDTVQLHLNLPGVAPWTIIVTDGVGIDTITGIPVSPFVIPVNPTVTTTYAVLSYMDANEILIQSDFEVTVTVNPAPVVTIDGFAPLCDNVMPVVLTGGLPSGGDYSGNGVVAGEFDPALAGAGTHVITYMYPDINGCFGSADTIIEVNPSPVAAITGALDTICLNHSVTLDAGAGFDTYLWSNASTGQTLIVDGAAIGANNTVTFTVTVTNTWGCADAASVTITAIDCIGIEDFQTNATLSLYPNPNDGNFTLHLTGVHGKATLRVVRATGDLVHTENITLKGDFTQAFNMDHLATGVYFVQVVTQTGVITEKVVIR